MADITLTGPLEKARGVIGRYPENGERYVFEFDGVAPRTMHMLGVRRPLRVMWYADGELTFSTVLQPWFGLGRAPADRVVERRPA